MVIKPYALLRLIILGLAVILVACGPTTTATKQEGTMPTNVAESTATATRTMVLTPTATATPTLDAVDTPSATATSPPLRSSCESESLKISVTLPSGQWQCNPTSEDWLTIASPTIEIHTSTLGRGFFCEFPDDASCGRTPFYANDVVELDLWSASGEPKEIFGFTEYAREGARLWISIKYQGMETRPLDSGEEAELHQLLDSLVPVTSLPTQTAVPDSRAATATPAGDVMPGGPLYPIVDAELGYLLGGTQNGRWIDAQTYAPYLQDTERPYSTYTLAGFQGIVTGSPPVAPGGICSQPLVAFHRSRDLEGAVALITPWDAAPRLAQPLPTDTAAYREAVAVLLQGQGLVEPELQIDSIRRVDLEGDGVDEVLISASRLAAGTSAPRVDAGDYSLVVLRKVVDRRVVTIPLELDVYAEAAEPTYPFQYRVLGLLDLNGDGRLEILVEAQRYEGRRLTVYEVTSSGPQPVLEGGCIQ